MTQVKQKITQTYKVILSTGDRIQIDPDEVEKVIAGISEGSVVRLKKGFFNPSFFVGIIEDEERRQIWLEDTKHKPQEREGGMKPLKDIFGESPLKLKESNYAITHTTHRN